MSAASPSLSLRPSGRLRRRRIVNRIMESLGTAAALLAVATLGLVIVTVAIRAAPARDEHAQRRRGAGDPASFAELSPRDAAAAAAIERGFSDAVVVVVHGDEADLAA